ncbi:MAG TPA: hypothetical protein VJM15_03020 [Sphingomicrobium sp.]|nr:hypothetical protein [Sphingomicrobium sp.]
MFKSVVALAVIGAMSVPAVAQTTPTNTTAPAGKPQMVKKRVCERLDEDPYSRLGNRKICKTIEVPASTSEAETNQQAPSQPQNQGK